MIYLIQIMGLWNMYNVTTPITWFDGYIFSWDWFFPCWIVCHYKQSPWHSTTLLFSIIYNDIAYVCNTNTHCTIKQNCTLCLDKAHHFYNLLQKAIKKCILCIFTKHFSYVFLENVNFFSLFVLKTVSMMKICTQHNLNNQKDPL